MVCCRCVGPGGAGACRWSGQFATTGTDDGIRCGCIKGSAWDGSGSGIGVGAIYKYELRNHEGAVKHGEGGSVCVRVGAAA